MISISNSTKNYLATLLFLIGSILPSACVASTVQQVSLGQTTQGAQLVFEGQVISSQERYAMNGDPFTYFTFQILSVIKGTYTAPTIELGYMGGRTADGLIMYITDMRMPVVGEHGIYFVETLNQQQVHPLYGWQQGHYLVITSQAGVISQVVPVDTPAGAMVAAPTLQQFKQQVRALAGGGK